MADASSTLQILGVIIAGILAIYLLYKQAKEMEEMQKRLRQKPKLITVLSCKGRRVERMFKEGDYVGKKEPCNEEEGRIIAIYAEVEETSQKGKPRL
jgi:hypothetical protein